jgi:uroporphyrinogen decarboxylase
MVPFIFNTVMIKVQESLVGHKISEPTYTGINNAGWVGKPGDKAEVVPALTVTPETATILGLDAIQIQVLPPLFASSVVSDGVLCISGGLIESAEALAAVRLPDPDDDGLLRSVENMIKQYKGDFAMGARVRLCASPAINSIGMENISMFYADEDDTLPKTVEMYADWSRRMNKNLSELDFDFFWTFDDIAFSSNLLISPAMFREIFKDNMKKAASTITKPWIYHSDGNYQVVLDDIIDIGAYGMHPIEKSAMDTRWLKENYGSKLCLVGNIDIDYTLSSGTVQEVDDEVRQRIELLGPNGRYIISDSNSIPDGCKAGNLLAMAKAVEKYRHIY